MILQACQGGDCWNSFLGTINIDQYNQKLAPQKKFLIQNFGFTGVPSLTVPQKETQLLCVFKLFSENVQSLVVQNPPNTFSEGLWTP